MKSQLAEAILTEPGSALTEDAASIRLADTRTRMRSSEDEGERDVFLPGEDEESEDGDEDRDEEAEERRRRILTHSGAQLSRIDVSDDLDDYEIVGRDGSTAQGEGGGLSAKAGIILVRVLAYPWTANSHLTIRGSIMSSSLSPSSW